MENRFRGDVLIKSLDNVIRMLTYAEAKNGLLISFYMIVISLINYLFKPDFLLLKNIFFMLPVYIGLIIGLISFFPILNNVSIADKIIDKTKNFYFFGDLAKCSIQEVKEAYGIEEGDDIYISIAKQTIINSKIVNRKFLMFKLSIYCFTVFPVIFWLIYVCCIKAKEYVQI